MSSISSAAVLGCGVIGASWVEAFLSSGIHVKAWDPSLEVKYRLDAIAERHGASLALSDPPADAVQGVAFVQENGPESLETKRALFATIAPTLDQTALVASSTSTLQPTDLQQGSVLAERILIGHPFNPPHILPLVEVVGGADTSEAAIVGAMAFYRAIGKHPIRLHRERPGHLANRLQAALWREAVDAVASGQASVTDVDAAVTLALGPRWALMGPFATFHLGGGEDGLAHFLEHLGPAFERLWDDARRPQMTTDLKNTIVRGVSERLGDRTPAELAAVRDCKLLSILSLAAAETSSRAKRH